MKVLHYKSNFLNASETFIKRLIDNHRQVEPAAMCIQKRDLLPSCPIFRKPTDGISGLINTVCFHLNWSLPFYTETIEKVNPDVIHAHFGFDGYRMIKPSQKTGVPLVVSFHGSDVSRLPSEFDWKRRYRKLAKHGSAFTAVSRRMKSQLVDLGFPEHKIRIIRCGLDLKEFSFNPSYSVDQNVLMVGRMVEKKGHVYALEAIKILNDRGAPVQLDLYGDGELRDELKKKAEEWNIDHLVHFNGFRTVEEVRRAYLNHSLLLVPSVTASDGDQEGLPIALLEGMASGIPVLATNHSAIPEVITHNQTGLLVEEKNSKAIADGIQSVRNNKSDLATIRKNARNLIEKDFSIDRMVEQIEEIYRKVLKDSAAELRDQI